MGSVRIGVGTEWLADGRTWRVVRQLDAERLIVSDVAFHNEMEIGHSEILHQFSTGTLVFQTEAEPFENVTSATRPIDLRDLSEDDQITVANRWRQIEPLTRLTAEPRKPDFHNRASDLREAAEQVSASSLKRYYSRWRNSGGDRCALVPRTPRSGGRGRLRRNSVVARYPMLNRFVE
ncbi:MAG: hypothetical protein ACKVII_27690, partial [Planctomycetales bacterium]